MEAGGKLGDILVYAARVIVTGCKANLLRQGGKLLDELTLGIGRKQCKVHLIGIRHGVTLGGKGCNEGADSCMGVLDIVHGVFAVLTQGKLKVELHGRLGAGVEEIAGGIDGYLV